MMEIEVAENVMPRDMLEKSNCCRFCGLGSSGRPEFNVSFIPIYAVSDMLNLNERLDVLINRYLPLKVCQTDLYFPRVICSTCYYSLEETIQFFDKIATGQKIMMKIINQSRVIEPKRQKVEVELDYSGENPLLHAPKRRGRPRKDPNKPKEPKPLPPIDVDKPKRLSRPPVRYTSEGDVVKFLDEIKQEENSNDGVKEKAKPWDPDGTDDFLSFQPIVFKPDASMSLEALESQNEFSGLATGASAAPTLLELEKLNIIMDPDEELDRLVPPNKEQGITDEVDGIPVTMARVEFLANDVVPSPPEQSDIPEVIAIINKLEEDRGNDSDASVRTIDIIQNKKKKKKKGRRKKKAPVLQCPDCDKMFAYSSSLNYHRGVIHGYGNQKKYPCTLCPKTFSHKTLLTAHQFTHSDEKCFKCDQCVLRFKSKASLYTHKKSVHCERKQFTCDQCGSQFNLKASLSAHLRIHTGEKPYSCEYCAKTFTQSSNMREHRRIHTGERPYKCAVANCEKSFTTASQLRCHKQTHTGIKRFLCSMCGKGFTHGENFKYHMKRHTGDHPLMCPLCPKRFIEPWSLKKHWRSHTGEKPYTCLVCNKDFADPSNYAKHKKIHQDGQGREIVPTSVSYATTPVDASIFTQGIEIQGAGEISGQPEGEQSLTERLIAAGVQVVETEEDSTNITSDGSVLRVLNTEGLDSIDSGDCNQQFIYVYPDELPIFTITLSDGQQSIEVRADDEGTLQALGNMASAGPIRFATVDTSGPSQQYFKLEALDGSTSFVPVIEGVNPIAESLVLGTSLELAGSGGDENHPLEIESAQDDQAEGQQLEETLVTVLDVQQELPSIMESQNDTSIVELVE